MKKAVIYYFSGSGNTKWICETTEKKLIDQNYEVYTTNVEESRIHPEHNNADIIGFVFPIYGFGLPHLAVRFINQLPKSQSQKSFAFLVPSMHEGIGIIQVLAILKLKGYKVVNAHSVYMPDTWTLVVNAPDEEKFQKYSDKNTRLIDKYIQEIIEEKKSRGIANPVLMFFLGLIYLTFYFAGRHQAGKAFNTSKKCNSCQTCYSSCPSKSIKWLENKPYWSWNCQQCFRCMNKCPQDAVEISGTAMLVGFPAFFIGKTLYQHLPNEILAQLQQVSPLLETLAGFASVFGFIWITQFLMHKELIPKLNLTKNRRRYKLFK